MKKASFLGSLLLIILMNGICRDVVVVPVDDIIGGSNYACKPTKRHSLEVSIRLVTDSIVGRGN